MCFFFLLRFEFISRSARLRHVFPCFALFNAAAIRFRLLYPAPALGASERAQQTSRKRKGRDLKEKKRASNRRRRLIELPASTSCPHLQVLQLRVDVESVIGGRHGACGFWVKKTGREREGEKTKREEESILRRCRSMIFSKKKK